jgi:hypothetical protein
LRVAVLLCLGAAAVSLVALGSEYPGATAAGRRVALREVLPLALLPWAHLAALESLPGRRAAGAAAVAALGDVTLLVARAGGLQAGAPPLSLALPIVAALLLAGTLGVAWLGRRAGGAPRTAS